MKKIATAIVLLEAVVLTIVLATMTSDVELININAALDFNNISDEKQIKNFEPPMLATSDQSSSSFAANHLVGTYKNFVKEDYAFLDIVDLTEGITGREMIKDVIFTILNEGYDTYSILCVYDGCREDAFEIANDSTLLSAINNYLHPYNRFVTGDLDYSLKNGKERITFTFIKEYDETKIIAVENEVNKLYAKYGRLSVLDQIRRVHDDIIAMVTYDDAIAKNLRFQVNESNAYGSYIEKSAVCGGYADALAIYLEKINIPTYKVSSETHIWNVVKINGEWLHIDVTWDDQKYKQFRDDYFLITYRQLMNQDNESHNFIKKYYPEAM